MRSFRVSEHKKLLPGRPFICPGNSPLDISAILFFYFAIFQLPSDCLHILDPAAAGLGNRPVIRFSGLYFLIDTNTDCHALFHPDGLPIFPQHSVMKFLIKLINAHFHNLLSALPEKSGKNPLRDTLLHSLRYRRLQGRPGASLIPDLPHKSDISVQTFTFFQQFCITPGLILNTVTFSSSSGISSF